MVNPLSEIPPALHRDHHGLLLKLDRMQALCTSQDSVKDCSLCQTSQQMLCESNLGAQMRGFIEATVKHNLIEASLMAKELPAEERKAHLQDHNDLALELQAIRAELGADGNSAAAIRALARARAHLIRHIDTFDAVLEDYLFAAQTA